MQKTDLKHGLAEPTTAAQLHQTMDADFWAKAFMEIRKDQAEKINLDLMSGWFANALMCGWDHAHQRLEPELEAGRKVVEAVMDGDAMVIDGAVEAYNEVTK